MQGMPQFSPAALQQLLSDAIPQAQSSSPGFLLSNQSGSQGSLVSNRSQTQGSMLAGQGNQYLTSNSSQSDALAAVSAALYSSNNSGSLYGRGQQQQPPQGGTSSMSYGMNQPSTNRPNMGNTFSQVTEKREDVLLQLFRLSSQTIVVIFLFKNMYSDAI